MAALLLNDLELLQGSREEIMENGGIVIPRHFKIPTDLLATYRPSFAPGYTNYFPGILTTWAVGTTYQVGALVQGDGSPDSYAYECILESTGNEPPNATYWKRAQYIPYVFACRPGREHPGAPGFTHVVSIYKARLSRPYVTNVL